MLVKNNKKTGMKMNYLTRDYNRYVKTTEIIDPDTTVMDREITAANNRKSNLHGWGG